MRQFLARSLHERETDRQDRERLQSFLIPDDRIPGPVHGPHDPATVSIDSGDLRTSHGGVDRLFRSCGEVHAPWPVRQIGSASGVLTNPDLE